MRVYIGTEDVDAHTVKAFQHSHLLWSVSVKFGDMGQRGQFNESMYIRLTCNRSFMPREVKDSSFAV